jgi:hypothetical protein
MKLSDYINPATDRPWRKGGRDPRRPLHRVRVRCAHQRKVLARVGGLTVAII